MQRRVVSHPHRRFWKTAVALAGLLLFGTTGFWLLEGMKLLDALYMAVITLSTVGFGEVRPLSSAGEPTILFRHHGSHIRSLPPVPMEVEGDASPVARSA